MKLHISNGNTKLGQIPNISLPPVITCRKSAPCASDGCYALKFYKMYPSCKTAWDENLEYYREDARGFWEELGKVFKRTQYFRYFVSGDIPDMEFLEEMNWQAFNNPHTEFLCFTKQFELVNTWLDGAGGSFEPNLHLILSTWEGFTPENPYNLPTSAVYEDGQEIPEGWKLCGGNCSECGCRGVGCWQLKEGETIAFKKH